MKILFYVRLNRISLFFVLKEITMDFVEPNNPYVFTSVCNMQEYQAYHSNHCDNTLHFLWRFLKEILKINIKSLLRISAFVLVASSLQHCGCLWGERIKRKTRSLCGVTLWTDLFLIREGRCASSEIIKNPPRHGEEMGISTQTNTWNLGCADWVVCRKFFQTFWYCCAVVKTVLW